MRLPQRLGAAAVLLCGCAAACVAAVDIPPANRIGAQVVARLEAPGDAAMDKPTDIAVGADGSIYVADGVKGRVVAFRADGDYAGAITAVGEVTLVRPVGVHVDAQGRLWIADPALNRVLAAGTSGPGFPATAPLLLDVQPPRVPRGETFEPADPTDVAVSADGTRVYIVDNDHDRIVLQDLRTATVQVIGAPGRALGQFEWPFAISVGPDGNLYVTEAVGARVQRITAAGRPSGQIGRWGIEVGQLYRPKGVVVSPQGIVYVSDSTLAVVQLFRSDGTYLGVLTDLQGQPLRFAHPMGLALDGQGRLYVVELLANRVSVVTVAGSAPATRPAGGGPAR